MVSLILLAMIGPYKLLKVIAFMQLGKFLHENKFKIPFKVLLETSRVQLSDRQTRRIIVVI